MRSWSIGGRASVWAQTINWGWRPTLLRAGLSFGLVLTGGSGVAAMCGVVPWLALAAYDAFRKQRFQSALCAGLAVVGNLAYTLVVTLLSTRPEGHPQPAGLVYTARYALRLRAAPFTMELGIADAAGIGVARAIAVVAVAYALSVKGRLDASARSAALLLGCLAVAGAVAFGRAGFGTRRQSSVMRARAQFTNVWPPRRNLFETAQRRPKLTHDSSSILKLCMGRPASSCFARGKFPFSRALDWGVRVPAS